MKKRLCYFILPISFFAALPICAEIATDGTVGPQITLSGPDFQIGEDLGSRVGANLFHSFQTFSIQQGESATFTGANDIANVISRVTGGSVSSINGLLKSQIAGADFYLINPAGIIFGQNAQIDVPAAFHASTADSLNFADGSQFNAANPDASTLSIATPSSFGFTQRQVAQIIMDGSTLTAEDGQHFSFTADELELKNTEIYNESGTISLVAVGDQEQQVELHVPLLEQEDLNVTGKMTLDTTHINVSGDGGGQINLAAGATNLLTTDLFNTNTGTQQEVAESNIKVQSLLMDNAWIKNDSVAIGEAPSINLLVNHDLAILNGSIVSNSSFDQGDSGYIIVEANNLTIDGQGAEDLTGIVSNVNTGSSGNAGTVDVRVSGTLEILDQGEIASNTFGSGNAGEVKIHAYDLYIDGKNAVDITGVVSQSVSSASGDAGSIEITVENDMEIFDAGFISSSTFSEADAGSISIQTNTLYINRFDSDHSTGIFNNSGGNATGDAGDITIQAGDWVSIVDGGKISSSTFAQGDAGNIELTAKQLFLHGNGSIYNTGIISNVESEATGNAGILNIQIDGLTEIYAGATLGSNTFSTGDAGTVFISSNNILIDDLGANELTAIVSQTNSTGHAGELNIQVKENLILQNGGEISTNTFGEGNAGTINISSQNLTINNQEAEILTGIISNSAGMGDAGAVNIQISDDAQIINGGQIASSAFAQGDAGEVKVTANSMTIDRKTSNDITGIQSNAQEDSEGDAGTVSVIVNGTLNVVNGGKIVSNTESVGAAGSVSIQAQDLYLDGQGNPYFTGISSNAEVGSSGDAGQVIVDVSGLIAILSAAEIGSNTFAEGDAGEIRVNTQNLLIDAGESNSITGIFSDAITGSSGNAGLLDIQISQDALLQNGGKIGSNTYSSGNAGDIYLTAQNLLIDGQDYLFDTGVTSIALSGSTGNAGSINIEIGDTLEIRDGGEISTNTAAAGDAGIVSIVAKNINLDREDNSRFTGIFSDAESESTGNAGSLKVTVTDHLKVINGAWLSSNTQSVGNAGDIELITHNVTLDANNTGVLTGVFSNAFEDSNGDAGSIFIKNSGLVSILNGASIASTTRSTGDAGVVSLDSLNLYLDLGNSPSRTGIYSDAGPVSSGNAGLINILVRDALEIYSGANISSNTFGTGNAGSIQLTSGSITLDGQGTSSTGIFSNSESTDRGNAGSIAIQVDETFSILNGAAIGSNTFSNGDAGQINIQGKNLTIDAKTADLFTGIASQAVEGTGNAGFLDIEMSGHVQLLHGGKISTDTFAPGNAGDILLKTNRLTIDRQGNQDFATGIFSNTRSTDQGNAGSIQIQASGEISIVGGGEISSSTFSKGDAGFIQIETASLNLNQNGDTNNTGIFSIAKGGSEGNAGFLDINSQGLVTIKNGAAISTDTLAVGHAGDVKLSAEQLYIDAEGNQTSFTGIFSNTQSTGNGNAGGIEIEVEKQLQMLGGALISSNTYSAGDAGFIQINSGSILLDVNNREMNTGFFSDAKEGSTGDAGTIHILNKGEIEVFSGARISSNTEGTGNAGDIKISSEDITVDAKSTGIITGIVTNAKLGSRGQAGSIEINNSGNINVLEGGTITSITESSGDAGSIKINTYNLTTNAKESPQISGILSDARPNSSGNAGQILIEVANNLEVYSGSQISSNTYALGDAGNIQIISNNIYVDRKDNFSTGILSNTYSTAQGNAGSINIIAHNDLHVIGGAQISSNTFSPGNAGLIEIDAKSILLDVNNSQLSTGFFSDAKEGSSGNAGTITIQASELIEIFNGAFISSNTEQSGDAGDIKISSGAITIDPKESGFITGIATNAKAGSSGQAGNIEINNQNQIKIINGGTISSVTEASGNAGSIRITSHDLLTNAGEIGDLTGILSDARTDSTGNAGQIEIVVGNNLEILQGAQISSNTFGKGNAGNIQIQSHNIYMDRKDSFSTGVLSNTQSTSQGNAGSIDIIANNEIQILNGASISSNTYSPGFAGVINVSAKNIVMDRQGASSFTGIFSDAKEGSGGNAGSIQVTTQEKLTVNNGAWISSNTESQGGAGDIKVAAQNITLDGQDSGIITGILSNAKTTSTGNAGTIEVDVEQQLEIFGGAEISSNTEASGNAGEIVIQSGGLQIDNKNSNFLTGIFSNAETDSQGDAGQLKLMIDNHMLLSGGGKISTNTQGTGNAGDIIVKADSLTIDRNDSFATGIFSDSKSVGTGNAGSITVEVEQQLAILNGGEISSNTFSAGHAGVIQVNAGNIHLDRNGASGFNGIFSDAKEESQGNAGTVKIQSAGLIEILDGAWISSNTEGAGNAGDIEIISGELMIDGEDKGILTGVFSNAESQSQGHAGSINITNNGKLEVLRGGQITSNTKTVGDAGSIQITSQEILLDSQGSNYITTISTNALEGSQGQAGQIQVNASQSLQILNGTEIGSNTEGSGDAGNIHINAGELTIDSTTSTFFTGIGSDTFGEGSGHAGEIIVSVEGKLTILRDGTISSISNTSGNAGKISIHAHELFIDAQNSNFSSITSESRSGSSGEVGDIDITAHTLQLTQGAQISINAAANIVADEVSQQHHIVLTANEIYLDQGSKITAESSNLSPAASISITTEGNFELNNISSVSTAAEISDGGPIEINSGLVSLDNSFITTSVSGGQGDGGNISVTTPALVMKTGFIQGNTAAAGASGGDILIDTPQLIFPSNQVFLTNQDERISFVPGTPQNVIQAAAPDGVSGNVTVTAPTLDISSSILNISTRFTDQTKISKNPCKVSAGEIPSSLTWAGQGGLPASHSDSIRLPMGKRLQLKEQDQQQIPKQQQEQKQTSSKTDKNNSSRQVVREELSQLGCHS